MVRFSSVAAGCRRASSLRDGLYLFAHPGILLLLFMMAFEFPAAGVLVSVCSERRRAQ
jgi:hypothetical protein